MSLYSHFFSLHLRCELEYKKSFFMGAIGGFFVSFSGFLSVYFLFQRFHSIENFSFSQVLLSFSTVLMAFSLAECFFRGFDRFDMMIGNGEFDRILVRPCSTTYLVACSKLRLDRISRVVQGIVMLVYALPRCGVQWTAARIAVLVLMILCGTVVFGCLFICRAALAFFTLEGLEFMNIFTDGGREFGAYPFAVYGKGVLRFLTFVIPLACCQYWPMLWLMEQSNRILYAACPLFSLLFIAPTCGLWKFGVRKYRSTGS